MRYLLIILAILVVSFGVFLASSRETQRSFEIDSLFLEEPETYTLLFVGDIMLERGVDWRNQRYGTGEPTYPFKLIADALKETDLTIGNLEGPISDKGVRVGSIYSFRMDPKYIEGLKFAGFDVLSLANNHMLDYTAAALTDTVERLRIAGIGTAGVGKNYGEANAAHIEELPDGTRIAFLSYTNLMPDSFKAGPNSPGLSDDNLSIVQNSIDEIRNSADIIVLLWHWGDEYQTQSHPREQEIARTLIDAGADLIVGHHPHVAQEIETYSGKTIAYSLGNFIFDQDFSEETMKGLMLEVKVKEGQIISASPIPISINSSFQPFLTQEK
jgi:poly-gamma-glutamate capsule biosynthesis protein CapA/YwtB (metallophosphatase superfamily)